MQVVQIASGPATSTHPLNAPAQDGGVLRLLLRQLATDGLQAAGKWYGVEGVKTWTDELLDCEHSSSAHRAAMRAICSVIVAGAW